VDGFVSYTEIATGKTWLPIKGNPANWLHAANSTIKPLVEYGVANLQ
jgi:hypothetical protein